MRSCGDDAATGAAVVKRAELAARRIRIIAKLNCIVSQISNYSGLISGPAEARAQI